MASVVPEQGITWASAASKTVSANTIQWSDPIACHADDWDGSITVHADNQGTPAAGDTCEVYVGWTNGNVDGSAGDDYDSDEHAENVGKLDTYPTNTPGEDPARRTWQISVSGKKGFRIGVICPQAATRNILVRAIYCSHRG